MARRDYGMEGLCPVRLGQVGLALSFLGEAKLGVVGCWVAKLCTVRWGEALLWYGDVLFGVGGVGWGTALSGMALCGMVWSREALHSIVELGPVRHCIARHGTARHSPARYCAVRSFSARRGSALCGGAHFGEAKPGIVMNSMARHGVSWRGGVQYCIAWRGSVGRSLVMCGVVLLGRAGRRKAMFCTVGWYPVRHRIVRSGTVVSCLALLCAARCASPQIFGEVGWSAALNGAVWRGDSWHGPAWQS